MRKTLGSATNTKRQKRSMISQPNNFISDVERTSKAVHGKKILIVDDEHTCINTVTRLLEGYGAEVHSTSSGTEALEFLKSSKFDLLVLDVMMPDMDGWELYAMIRQDLKKHNKLPILFYSGLVDDIQAKFLNEGPSEYSRILAKGGALAELVDAVTDMLENLASKKK